MASLIIPRVRICCVVYHVACYCPGPVGKFGMLSQSRIQTKWCQSNGSMIRTFRATIFLEKMKISSAIGGYSSDTTYIFGAFRILAFWWTCGTSVIRCTQQPKTVVRLTSNFIFVIEPFSWWLFSRR